jgi:hypothetical protein
MKTTPLFTLLLLFFAPAIFAGTDTEPAPKPDQAIPIELLPRLKVLYFNQVIDFTVNSTGTVIDHVEFNRGLTELIPGGFRLMIEYANVEEARGLLEVYTRDANGTIQLAYSQSVLLTQKLKDYVNYHDDLFMLDSTLIDLNSTLSKYQLLNAGQIRLNSNRFDAENIQMAGFDMEISNAGNTQKFHSPDGTVTEEMKSAIRKLSNGDKVKITNIMGRYKAAGQTVPMNINYTPVVTIGTVG